MDKKMMWKAAACAAAVLGMAFMAGCGGSAEKKAEGAPQGKLMQQIKEKGQLVVGTASGFPPYEFIDTSKSEKTVAGIDIKLAQAIADKLGVKLRPSRRIRWTSPFPASAPQRSGKKRWISPIRI